MIEFEQKPRYDLEDLCRIVHILRHEGGCSWDQAQTHASIRRCMLEEAYEVCEAIDLGSAPLLLEELGDVLLQVVFHADIASDEQLFTLEDVANGVARKMVTRHPHVFGGEVPSGGWDALKRLEKAQRSTVDTLNAVARSLPALWRAEKIQKKAASLQPAAPQPSDDPGVRLGDALFALAGEALAAGIDPEAALHAACDRYIARCADAERAESAAL